MHSKDPVRSLLELEATLGAAGAEFLLGAGRQWLANPACANIYPIGAPQLCFSNAFHLACLHPELTYVEGRARGSIPIPVEHAWCVDLDGNVIETTWPSSADTYYFGVAFDTDWLRRWISKREHYGVLAGMFPKELLDEDLGFALSHAHGPSTEAAAQTQARIKRRIEALRPIATQE